VTLLGAAGLPTEDLARLSLEHFFFAGPVDAPTGLVGLEMFGDVALLRSLVVAEPLRGSGAGSALLDHAERHARSRGVKVVYLLTTTAEAFFARRGYGHAARASAPTAIRATREFSALCPSSSAFMSRQL
jgi:amino-acid N-acetyltransferase